MCMFELCQFHEEIVLLKNSTNQPLAVLFIIYTPLCMEELEIHPTFVKFSNFQIINFQISRLLAYMLHVTRTAIFASLTKT